MPDCNYISSRGRRLPKRTTDRADVQTFCRKINRRAPLRPRSEELYPVQPRDLSGQPTKSHSSRLCMDGEVATNHLGNNEVRAVTDDLTGDIAVGTAQGAFPFSPTPHDAAAQGHTHE